MTPKGRGDNQKKKILVTGGAGFIGSNLAVYFGKRGHRIRVYDNLTRTGSQANIAWIGEELPHNLEFTPGDVRDPTAVKTAIRDVDAIFHCAAQVAVTTSVQNPREDFEINAGGTLNVLEGARAASPHPTVFFFSTNKVYGELKTAHVVPQGNRYVFEDGEEGVGEEWPLDFYSPYGCSKGAADQYVRDYHRIYAIPTVVFRLSCIYGPRQFGTEDQGWLAHFVISAAKERTITIYGDGKQTRDVLYITDLARAFELAMEKIFTVRGQVYNLGGGKENSLSLLEIIRHLEQILGKKIHLTFEQWRPGDQKAYVTDTSKARRDLGWAPTVAKEEGVKLLLEWVRKNTSLFQ